MRNLGVASGSFSTSPPNDHTGGGGSSSVKDTSPDPYYFMFLFTCENFQGVTQGVIGGGINS